MNQALRARERTEELERASLSIWARLAAESKGRDRFEEPDPLRTAFQQDRDRILGSQAFRRLPYRTHTLLVEPSAGPRTRLAHTLQVLAAATTVGRALRLNVDLVEAVALAHGVGGPPFGAAGVRALSAFLVGGFDPAEQGLRVVEKLERGGSGLNLTWEVRDGVWHHSWGGPPPATVEGQVVRAAGRIVDVCAAAEEALAAGIVDPRSLAQAGSSLHGEEPSAWIAGLVHDVAASSSEEPEVRMSKPYLDALDGLEALVARAISSDPATRGEHDRAEHCLRSVVTYHLQHPARLRWAPRPQDPLVERVVDHVSGLSDRGARQEFEAVFSPGSPLEPR